MARWFDVVVSVGITLGLSGCGHVAQTQALTGDAGGAYISSPSDPNERATMPAGVPKSIGFACWIHGVAVSAKRALPNDVKFREQAATMYACIAQRMPPNWRGHAGSLADVNSLLTRIRVKDPTFVIVPWTHDPTIKYE